MIKKLENNEQKKFIDLVNKLNEDDEFYSYIYLLDNLDCILKTQTIILSINNDKINGFAIISNDNPFDFLEEKFKSISIYYYRNQSIKKELFDYIVSNYKNIVMITNYAEKLDIEYLTIQSMDLNNEGNLEFNTYQNILMDKSCDFLKNKYLDYYNSNFKDFSTDKLEFKYLTKNEMEGCLFNNKTNRYIIPIFEKYHSLSSFLGFKYFNSEDIFCGIERQEYEERFLCALYNNIIIGLIKVVLHKNEQCYYVYYIDVNNDFKRKGISKLLVKNLNQYLDNNLPLVGSRLSEEGVLCKMNDIFNKYITNTKYYNSKEEL